MVGNGGHDAIAALGYSRISILGSPCRGGGINLTQKVKERQALNEQRSSRTRHPFVTFQALTLGASGGSDRW